MKTTLNIDKAVLEKVEKLSDEIGVSRTKIIQLAMNQLINEKIKSGMQTGGIKYQKRRNKDKWHTFHIDFGEAEYEQFSDIKRILKKSLSFLVALAIESYEINMGIVLNCKNNDNYRLNVYTAITKFDGKVHGYEFYWGIPEENTIKRLKL